MKKWKKKWKDTVTLRLLTTGKMVDDLHKKTCTRADQRLDPYNRAVFEEHCLIVGKIRFPHHKYNVTIISAAHGAWNEYHHYKNLYAQKREQLDCQHADICRKETPTDKTLRSLFCIEKIFDREYFASFFAEKNKREYKLFLHRWYVKIVDGLTKQRFNTLWAEADLPIAHHGILDAYKLLTKEPMVEEATREFQLYLYNEGSIKPGQSYRLF